jgi:hypothetical protein
MTAVVVIGAGTSKGRAITRTRSQVTGVLQACVFVHCHALARMAEETLISRPRKYRTKRTIGRVLQWCHFDRHRYGKSKLAFTSVAQTLLFAQNVFARKELINDVQKGIRDAMNERSIASKSFLVDT